MKRLLTTVLSLVLLSSLDAQDVAVLNKFGGRIKSILESSKSQVFTIKNIGSFNLPIFEYCPGNFIGGIYSYECLEGKNINPSIAEKGRNYYCIYFNFIDNIINDNTTGLTTVYFKRPSNISDAMISKGVHYTSYAEIQSCNPEGDFYPTFDLSDDPTTHTIDKLNIFLNDNQKEELTYLLLKLKGNKNLTLKDFEDRPHQTSPYNKKSRNPTPTIVAKESTPNIVSLPDKKASISGIENPKEQEKKVSRSKPAKNTSKTNPVINAEQKESRIQTPKETESQNTTTSQPEFTITNPKKNTSISIGFSKNEDGVTIGFQVFKDDNPISFLPTDYALVEITFFGKDVKFHTFNITQTQLGVADGNPEVSLDKTEWSTFYKKAVNTNCKLISVVGKTENGQKTFTEMFTLSDSEIKLLQLQIATVAETKKSTANPAKQVQVNNTSVKQPDNNKQEKEISTLKSFLDEMNTDNQTSNTSQEKSTNSAAVTTNKTTDKPETSAASNFFTVTNSSGINISFAFAKQSDDQVIMKISLSKDDLPYTFPANSLVSEIGLYKKGAFKVNDPMVIGVISNAMLGNSSFIFKYNKKNWNSLYAVFRDDKPEFVMFKVYKKGENIKEIFDLTPEQVAGIIKQIKEIGKL